MKVATLTHVMSGSVYGEEEFDFVLGNMIKRHTKEEETIIYGVVDIVFWEDVRKVIGPDLELIPVKTMYMTSAEIASSNIWMTQLRRRAMESMNKTYAKYSSELFDELNLWLSKREMMLKAFDTNQFLHLHDRDE